MKIISPDIDGLKIIQPNLFGDNRGFFTEIYREDKYVEAGIPNLFVQDNLSFSVKHTLRGLHFQKKHPQAKLVQVLMGEVLDVVVDLRHTSATFGHYYAIVLSGETQTQFFIPEGFAHGFCVLSETALFLYKCSDFYHPEDEGGLLWNDPQLAIPWGVEHPILSDKDNAYPRLAELKKEDLPSIA